MYGDIPYSNTLRYSDTLITRHIHFLNLYVDTVYIYIYICHICQICTYVATVFPEYRFLSAVFLFQAMKGPNFRSTKCADKAPETMGKHPKQTNISHLSQDWGQFDRADVFSTFFVAISSLFLHVSVCDIFRFSHMYAKWPGVKIEHPKIGSCGSCRMSKPRP